MSLTEPRTTDAVRTFAALSHDDVMFAGGKGANLGELTAAGLPVPGGFVVGAPAYAAFCATDDLRDRIEAALSAVDVDDTAALAEASASVRAMVEATPIPPSVEEAIRTSYGALGGEPAVAVRSSATAEDTESASFAGMNETYLNIV